MTMLDTITLKDQVLAYLESRPDKRAWVKRYDLWLVMGGKPAELLDTLEAMVADGELEKTTKPDRGTLIASYRLPPEAAQLAASLESCPRPASGGTTTNTEAR